MKRIDPQTVQRIIDSADIVEVVSDFVELKRRGANYMGLCPFHNERTPSFSVNRARGICKCFSCGEGGNAVNFVMKIRQCGYGEALRYLAQKYGIEIKEAELTERELRQRQERDSLFASLQAADNYLRAMRNSDEGASALAQRLRGIAAPLLDRAGIGYAPQWPTAMLDALAPQGFTPEALTAAGVAADGRDLFSGAVTVGVRNRYGRVAGFVAYDPATLERSAQQMTADTAVWHPADEIAGLWEGRSPIAKAHCAVIAHEAILLPWLYQSGIDNAIALTGGTFTPERIKGIKRLTSDVILLLPPDKRGIFETLRGALPLLSEEISVKVASLPGREPLPSFAASHTSDEVEQAVVADAVDMVIYRINALRRAAPSSAAFRTLFDDIILTLRCVGSPLLREAYINELADATHLAPRQLEKLLR